MDTELRERLDRLAGHAPVALDAGHDGRAGAAGLWRRGRRRQVAGTAGAVLALVVVAAGVGVGSRELLAATEVPVADRPATTATTVVPDRLVDPSPWAGTSEDAAGPLLMVAGAERRTWWGGVRNGLVGISAVDGMPRMLDLPGYDLTAEPGSGDPAALSSDGRYLAWWTVAEPAPVDPGGPGGVGAVDGLAVLDTVTGERRHREVSGSGLGQVGAGLVWAGDVLWAQHHTLTEVSGSSWSTEYADTLRWDLGTGRVADGMPAVRAPSLGEARSGPIRSLAEGDRGYVVLEGARATRTVRLAPTRGAVDQHAVSPDGRRVAALRAGDGAVGGDTELLVGRVAPGAGTTTLSVAATVPADQVLGWADERRVVVTTWEGGVARVATVDVTTGEPTRVSRFDRGSWAPTPVVATELVDGERVVVGDPPPVPDPRWVALTVAALLGLGAWLWRRRRGSA